MKKFLPFILLSLASQCIYSQNWAPINTTEKFCFESDTAERISHVLWVDSVEMFTDFDVYYLNKVTTPFDWSSMYVLGANQFLYDSIIIREEGSWEFGKSFDNNPNYFTILPHASIYDTWEFKEDITAEITSTGLITIFDEVDSVKTISLSYGNSIILSKNHGIINWMNLYELIGIEGRDLGINTIKFENMFSRISTGDIVCNYEGHWEADEQVTGWDAKFRYEILDIERDSHQIVINVHALSSYSYWYNPNKTVKSSYITTLVFYPNVFTETYLNEAIFIARNDFPQPQPYFDGYMIFKEYPHKWSGLKKSHITYMSYYYGPTSLFHDCDDSFPNAICAENEPWDCSIVEYSQDFGFVEYENNGFEWANWNKLVGVIDDGVTFGEIYPEDMFVGQNELEQQTDMFIFPSPTKDLLHIKTSQIGTANWKIFDLMGNIINQNTEFKTTEDLLIQVDYLPKGVFILQLQINDKIILEKFLKL